MTNCFGNECNVNYMRHVGYTENNECIQKLYDPSTIRTISCKITDYLEGVDKCGRPIVVPDKTICNVIDDIYQNFTPAFGDIYTRYSIPKLQPTNYVQDIIDQTIEVIVSDVKANLGMEQCNASLNVWDATLLGDFNKHGLRQYAPIKTLNKRTNGRGHVSFMSY
jgi:myosin-crossreactive antigen